MRRASILALFAVTALTPITLANEAAAKAPAWVRPMLQIDSGPDWSSPSAPPAVAAEVGPQALSDEDLSVLRGGFITTNGFTFGFGVVIRSYINDKLALQTQLTWTPTGAVTQQTRGDVPGAMDLASAMTALLNSGIDLTGLNGVSGGVAVIDGNGATALIHNVTTGQLQNLMVNSANNRNLRQDMELNLYLPDLAAMQAATSAQQRAAQITYDLNTSLVGSLGR
jgi:hypothetical protein